jgi:hypothetical protein
MAGWRSGRVPPGVFNVVQAWEVMALRCRLEVDAISGSVATEARSDRANARQAGGSELQKPFHHFRHRLDAAAPATIVVRTAG